jgi:hypothetical protein
VYRCEECGTADELRRLADERIERTLTRAERERFERLSGASASGTADQGLFEIRKVARLV